MERKNILFMTTAYGTGNIVYPIFPKLSKIHNIDVLNLFQMSKYTAWKGKWELDPRQKFYKWCDSLGIKTMHAPKVVSDKEVNVKTYIKFRENLDNVFKRNYYDLVMIDNNTHWKRMGLGPIYRHFAEQNIPYLACPHGNKDYLRYKALKRVGRLYDFSFVFGEKEKRKLCKIDRKYVGNADRLLPAGLPASDKLKDYPRNKDHILLIVNFTKRPPQGGQTSWQKPFTIETFKELKLAKLSEEYNCPILIKEKYRLYYEDLSLRKSLKKYKSIVKFMSVCEDDNKLMADSCCVISAPSTLTFKPIQLGVPTVVLSKFGMNGNFGNFSGLMRPNAKKMRVSFKKQEDKGRDLDFIADTIAGGVEYNSSDIYIDYINKILDGEITCL
ncbi:MAG: hypothetical protein ACTSSP_04595 [Candidatus Asgardarchaeia archaeon]